MVPLGASLDDGVLWTTLAFLLGDFPCSYPKENKIHPWIEVAAARNNKSSETARIFLHLFRFAWMFSRIIPATLRARWLSSSSTSSFASTRRCRSAWSWSRMHLARPPCHTSRTWLRERFVEQLLSTTADRTRYSCNSKTKFLSQTTATLSGNSNTTVIIWMVILHEFYPAKAFNSTSATQTQKLKSHLGLTAVKNKK